jgi:hypothetical protein
MMLQWLNTISTADQVQDSQRIHGARNASAEIAQAAK